VASANIAYWITRGTENLAHQYEMLKFPEFQFDWLIQHRRGYGEMARGELVKRFNINWVDHYEPGKYDLVILHLDQQCFEKNIMERGKGSLFRELNEVITDCPKVLIMHGTPYYPELYPAKNEFGEDCDGISQKLIDEFRAAAANCYVVCNSKKAAEQWGIGTPIIHGLDPNEWLDLPKELRIITMIGPAGLDKYYDRQFLQAVKEALAEEGIPHCHITVDWQAKNFDDYRNFIGRSLLYFNPTRESPMPRARTEAMMSGCCVLTTPHQDASDFIIDGKNGFLVPRNPMQIVDLVKQLFANYSKAVAIGRAGKETALKLFNWDRYHSDWLNFTDWIISDFNSKRK
jgi:hypothetical protein